VITTAQHHAIRRQVLDVTVNGTEAEGLALQGRLAALCRDWLTPALDDALARVAPGDEHWSIDSLDLDAGAFTLDTLERDFVDAVRSALENQIRERSSGRATRRRSGAGTDHPHNGGVDSPSLGLQRGGEGDTEFLHRTGAQATQDAFVHFLATGVLPWWFRLPPNETLESIVSATWNAEGNPSFIVSSTPRAIASPVAHLRLVRQFSEPFLEALLKVLAPETARAVERVAQQVMAQSGQTARRQRLLEQLWLVAFEAVSQRREMSVAALFVEWSRAVRADTATAAAERVIAEVARALSLPVPITPTEDRHDTLESRAEHPTFAPARAKRATTTGDGLSAESARGIDLDEGVFVDNAGVVLLHPFLPPFFERLGVAPEGNLIQPDRALALLHFLATSETRAPEYALVLPKLLCGLPLVEPVGSPVELTKDEIAEAENLLVAVIRHWATLGDTSPDALRGTFLTRPGKLSRRDGDDLLQVEPQSFDVLLDQLPWGIGAIRLPWMQRMLWVEWRM